jgi:hypothetical protein
MFSGPSQGRKRWRLTLPKAKAETPNRPSIMHSWREPIWGLAQGKRLNVHIATRANVAEMNQFCDSEVGDTLHRNLLWHCVGTTIFSEGNDV